MLSSCVDDGDLSGFLECDSQIKEPIDKSQIEERLRIQLEEVEMLQSMFSNPGEFEIFDVNVILDIKEFIEGKCDMLPPRIDFTLNLLIDEIKLQFCVNLPLDYPIEEPDMFVRSDSFTRTQQHKLNSDLSNYICSLGEGEICIYPSIAWLQENAASYFVGTSLNNDTIIQNAQDRNHVKEGATNKFSRYWIYSHHIYSKMKRRCILDLSQDYNVTGFCLPGKPGIICVEGWDSDCSDWWQRIRSMNWKKIMCKKKEEEEVVKDASIDSLRKFIGFEEISFDNGKSKSRDYHMDMGEFYKYLSNHECGYMFRDYFGFEGKASESVN